MKKFNNDRGSRFGGGLNKRNDRGGGDRRGRDGGRGEVAMHDAICNECHKPCQVPFRPTGDKPVYCKECFSKMGGGASGGNDRTRGDFKRFDKPRFDSEKPRFDTRIDRKFEGNEDLKRELKLVNAKLDTIIAAAERYFRSDIARTAAVSTPPVKEKESLKKIVKKALGKKPSKK